MRALAVAALAVLAMGGLLPHAIGTRIEACSTCTAADTTPSPGPAAAADRRLSPLTDLNAHFPFTPPATADEWRARAEALRRQIRVALGLWPWPTRTPLNPVVHGPVARDGYTVERVFFESMPGHFVTGSLYRPTGRTGRLPAVLSPHGHWPEGRFQDVEPKDVRQQLASGAERFENAARHPLQARAVQLARMGTIVFLYDMIGYADSMQLPRELVHHGDRESATPAGLFFSPQAEARLQSLMGLQVWNGIRALDWLTSRDDVDPTRIAVTGASGGGTQTMMIGAIDARPAVAFPAVMVSTAMQGGCTCENAVYLRVGTGNVEIAALFAPKPLGMTAADDWTKRMPEDGYPQLQQLYEMLGVPDHVRLFPFLQFGHNYNHVSRTAMYGWFNAHLTLGHPEPVLEQDFVPLTREEASVWNDAHPAPAGGEAHERAILEWWTEDSARQLKALEPRDEKSLAAWRDTVGGARRTIIGRPLPPADSITTTFAQTGDGARARAGEVRWTAYEERAGIVRFAPAGGAPAGPPGARSHVVWLHEKGHAGLLAAGEPIPPVRALLDAGFVVTGVDLFLQGQSEPPAVNRLVTDRPVAAFTFGYNAPLWVQRVHDALSVIRYARESAGAEGRVFLVGFGPTAGSVAAAARAVAGPEVAAAAIGTRGFRFESVGSFEDALFVPGSVKYGDVPALLALHAPGPLWVAGESRDGVALVRAAYRAAGAGDAIRLSRAGGAAAEREAAEWIVARVGGK